MTPSPYSVVSRQLLRRSGTLLWFLFSTISAGTSVRAVSSPFYDTMPVGLLSARSVRRVPSDLTKFLHHATEAVNTHSLSQAAPFASGEASRTLGWATETTTKIWQSDALILPETLKTTGAVEYLAVFHAWHSCESDGDHVHRLLSTPEGWKLGAEIPETETGGFRIRDHRLNVKLDIGKKQVTISDVIQIERTQEAQQPFALLRLSQDFRVRQCEDDGQEVPFQQAGGILLITPPAEKTFTLSLRYAGTVAHQETDYILADEATLDSYWYPHIARLPATATVTVTTPPGWTAIAPGEPISDSQNPEGSATITFRNDLPVSYLTLDAGRYTVTTRQANGIALSTYLLSRDTAAANQYLDLLVRSLRFYTERFGSFPFKRYAIVETRGAFEGALEAYSFATFGPHMLPETIPHELSHTWWGGLVPCTYTRSMWNEAFATYAETLFLRLSGGREPAEGRRPDYGTKFDAVPLGQARDTSDPHQEAVGYDKGGLVLRALEAEIGLDKLLQCIRAFVSTHPKGEAAEWSDFEHTVTTTTGQDYRWFFAQWLERTGAPTLRVTGLTVIPQDKGYVVEGDILQSDSPYRLSLPYRLNTRNGPLTGTLSVERAQTHFRLATPSRPSELILDPEFGLPLKFAYADSGAAGNYPLP